jgi:hypothetical protein
MHSAKCLMQRMQDTPHIWVGTIWQVAHRLACANSLSLSCCMLHDWLCKLLMDGTNRMLLADSTHQ